MSAEIIAVLVVMVLVLGAYWSLVTFPKQRDFQKRQRFARELAAGDEVITYGGLVGKVKSIDAEMGIAYVEIADGITVRLITAALMQPYNAEEIAHNARIGMREAELHDPVD